MKFYYLLFILVCLSFTTTDGPDSNTPVLRYFGKDLDYAPLKGNYLFILKHEISNGQYREYTTWTLRHKGEAAYRKILPDTLVWKSKLAFNEPYVNYYFRHPAYREYPVVGVSYSKAVDFCKWVADRIMETEDFKKLNVEKIELRLPSEEEWMLAARGKLAENAIWPWPGNTIRMEAGKKRDEGKIRLNIRRDAGDQGGFASHLNDAGFITTPVYSYWPNTIGLFNMCGNAAEWVEGNKTKGGSWLDFPFNARIDQISEVFHDTFSSSTIGFRPVLEIVSYKTSAFSKDLQLTAGMIEERMVPVKDDLYASKFETSNLLYNTFLKETGKSMYAPSSGNWFEFSRYHYMQQYSLLTIYERYPVVNISYEAAVAYCEWLSTKYNALKGRKYKKVIFKLPDENEWELAARGNLPYHTYPWGGPYYRNSRGAYLANFSPLEEQYLKGKNKSRDSADVYGNPEQYKYPNNDVSISRGADGLVFTGAVDSYYPNSIGLYNFAGNVAEMTSNKGVSKGGGWNSSQFFIQISSKETYTTPRPDLGFRVFMTVLEK